ncbi:hypothetical protein GmHk_19G053927 [Glycine max]|nr:hypothetical protein GmHk_19G053927 [Glycine max]
MPNKISNKIHLMYLTLLTNLRCPGRYSRGSACLATLYKEMSQTTKSWGWYRIPFVAPQCSRQSTYPLVLRWSTDGLHFVGTPHASVIGLRARIDNMRHDRV